MDQKFLKRLISECPLTDFSQNGNVTERELQLDKYLEQFTDFLYSNENQLIQHFWQEYIASSEIVLLQNSKMLRRCFIFLDCAVAIYNVSVNSSLNYSTHSPRILKGVISMFQGSSLFQSSAV